MKKLSITILSTSSIPKKYSVLEIYSITQDNDNYFTIRGLHDTSITISKSEFINAIASITYHAEGINYNMFHGYLLGAQQLFGDYLNINIPTTNEHNSPLQILRDLQDDLHNVPFLAIIVTEDHSFLEANFLRMYTPQINQSYSDQTQNFNQFRILVQNEIQSNHNDNPSNIPNHDIIENTDEHNVDNVTESVIDTNLTTNNDPQPTQHTSSTTIYDTSCMIM